MHITFGKMNTPDHGGINVIVRGSKEKAMSVAQDYRRLDWYVDTAYPCRHGDDCWLIVPCRYPEMNKGFDLKC